MNLEHELRRALRRKDPPSGFHEKVLSRIAAGETPRTRTTISIWPRVALPLAASLMLAFGGTYYVHRQQERQARELRVQTEQATREVVLALQIASEKISAAQAKVEEITRYDHTSTR
jgi:uncharacterized protein HemX